MPARSLVVLSLLLASGAAAWGQSADIASPTRLKRTVQPSFRIEPVVHRFRARRGEVVPFSFDIGSLGRDMDVEVKLVNLRQQESGVILHDSRGAAPGDVELLSADEFRLEPGETKQIHGRLTIPIAKTNYLSYGLLVREASQQPEYEETEQRSVKAGVRFVTQYVLRVDVETGVSGIGDIKQLRLEDAGVVSSNGLPVARAYLDNPTNFAFECFVSARFKSNDSKRAIIAKLGMPSRSGLQGDEKHLVRVMPHSRLRLESPIAKTLELGRQQMTVDLSSSRRKVLSATYEIDLPADEFPALASRRAVLRDGVVVSPSQIELGTTDQTKRIEAVSFKNTSGKTMEISLDPRTFADTPMDGVRFSPSTFTLKPGRTKKVRATLRNRPSESPQSGATQITVATSDGDATRHELPLSVLTAAPAPPQLSLSPIAWKTTGGWGAFVVAVTNKSAEYVPLDATLALQSRSGTRQLMQAGFGVWLAPGKSTDLVFKPEQQLVSDEYALGLQINTRDGFGPVLRNLRITLSEGNTTADARKAETTPGVG